MHRKITTDKLPSKHRLASCFTSGSTVLKMFVPLTVKNSAGKVTSKIQDISNVLFASFCPPASTYG
jgi:hypothetical protein